MNNPFKRSKKGHSIIKNFYDFTRHQCSLFAHLFLLLMLLLLQSNSEKRKKKYFRANKTSNKTFLTQFVSQYKQNININKNFFWNKQGAHHSIKFYFCIKVPHPIKKNPSKLYSVHCVYAW